jgi:AAA+ ATPase superfamily predicted ATPase
MFTLRPVCGEDFLDREELIQEMVETLASPTERVGFALVGRRRMGKTSVFLEVVRRLQRNPRVVSVYSSLWELVEGTPQEFARQLIRDALEAFQEQGALPLKVRARNLLSAPLGLLRDILREVRISLKLREELEVLLVLARGQEKSDPGELISRALGLPEGLAREAGVRCALFLDEFPTILELREGGKALGEGIVRKLRTKYERMEGLVLSISGSVRSTMEAVALSPASAFWRQFVVREVGPLPAEAVRELLQRNLNRPLTEEAFSALWEFTQGIPFYVQFLGRELARKVGQTITEAEVREAVEEFLKEEGGVLFQEEWQRLSPKERKIAWALARGHSAPSVIAREIEESPNAVSRYLQYLEEKGLVERTGRGAWQPTDPVFARWLAQRSL